MSGVVKSALTKRVQGKRSGPFEAIGAAVVVGVAAGVMTYRIVRK